MLSLENRFQDNNNVMALFTALSDGSACFAPPPVVSIGQMLQVYFECKNNEEKPQKLFVSNSGG